MTNVKLNLATTIMELNEFLGDKSIRQAQVRIPDKYGDHRVSNRYLFKLQGQNQITEVIEIRYDSFSQAFSVDEENKIVVFSDDFYNVYLEGVRELCPDYKFYERNEVSSDVINYFNTKVNEILTARLPEILSLDKYKKIYADTINNEKEKTQVTRDIAAGKDSYSYKAINGEAYENIDGYDITNRLNMLEFLTNTTRLDEIIKVYVEKMFEEREYGRSPLEYYIEIIARIKIKRDISINPSPEQKETIDIISSLKNGGKTVIVTLSNGDAVKVENDLTYVCHRGELRKVTGWDSIKINDIHKISFGRKTLFEKKVA